MKTRFTSLMFTALMAVAGAAAAQASAPPAPCADGTPGPGCARSGGMQPHKGMGKGMGGHGPRSGKEHTPGWSMMTEAERQAHRDQLRGLKTFEECKAAMDKHHEQMAARAKERGHTMPSHPRRDAACAGLKQPQK